MKLRLGIGTQVTPWLERMEPELTLPIELIPCHCNRGGVRVKGYTFVVGRKIYELSNHLGNVLSTISDRKIQASGTGGVVDYYLPDVRTMTDYYPFGMAMDGRTETQAGTEAYRYKFGGQESDNEIYGEGNSYTAEYWQYDPRLGRRWNLDPMVQVSSSNYSVFKNCPIYFIDIKGNQIDPNDTETRTNFDNHTQASKNRIEELDKMLISYSKDPVKYAEKIDYVIEAKKQMEATLTEMTALEKDPSVTLVIRITQFNSNERVDGYTTFDGSTITINYDGKGDVLNHELAHAYQNLTGDLVPGGYAADIFDEVAAKKRGFAFSMSHPVEGAKSFGEINSITIYPLYKGTVAQLPLNSQSSVRDVLAFQSNNTIIQGNLNILSNNIHIKIFPYLMIATDLLQEGKKDEAMEMLKQMRSAQDALLNKPIGSYKFQF